MAYSIAQAMLTSSLLWRSLYPVFSPEVPFPHSRKLAELYGLVLPHGTGPGKDPTHLSPTVSLLSVRMGHSHLAPHHCSLSLFSPKHIHCFSLIPSLLFFWLSRLFPNHLPISAGLIFTSSISQKFSALSLAVGPFWVSGSDGTDIIYPACLLTGYSDFVPRLIS